MEVNSCLLIYNFVKYVKLFENWQVEVDEVNKTIKDILLDITDKSQYGLRFISQFQEDRSQIAFKSSTTSFQLI